MPNVGLDAALISSRNGVSITNTVRANLRAHQQRKVGTYDGQARFSSSFTAKNLANGFNLRCISGNSASSVCLDV